MYHRPNILDRERHQGFNRWWRGTCRERMQRKVLFNDAIELVLVNTIFPIIEHKQGLIKVQRRTADRLERQNILPNMQTLHYAIMGNPITTESEALLRSTNRWQKALATLIWGFKGPYSGVRSDWRRRRNDYSHYIAEVVNNMPGDAYELGLEIRALGKTWSAVDTVMSDPY